MSVTAPANGQSVQYVLANSNAAPASGWQNTLVFTGLTNNTTYFIFARAVENNNYLVGAASAALQVTTDINTGIDVVETLHATSLQGFVQNNTLHISGATIGETLSVYNIMGQLIYHKIATSGEMEIPLWAKGIFIVKQGENKLKTKN